MDETARLSFIRRWLAVPTFGLCLVASTLTAQQDVRLVTGDAAGAGFEADLRVLDLTPDGKHVLFLGEPSRSGPSAGISRGGFYLRNLASGTITLLFDKSPLEAAVSADGRFVAYSGGANIWRFDRFASNPQPISGNLNEEPHTPQISDDGRFIAYASVATNAVVENPGALPADGLPYVVIYDSETQTQRIVTTAPDGSALDTGFGGVAWFQEFSFSGNGRYLFYSTDATNAHPDRDGATNQDFFWLYRRDLQTGEIIVAGKAADASVPPGNLTTPSTSTDGERVLFKGSFIGGDGLIPGYGNATGTDLYWKDLGSGDVIRVSATGDGAAPDGFINESSLSPNGLRAAFASSAKNLRVPDDENFFDIYSATILPDEGDVEMTQVSVGPDASRNVDYTSGPFAADDYVAFNTQQWEEMLDQAGAGPSTHGVAVGTFPPAPAGSGARISLLDADPVGFMRSAFRKMARAHSSLSANWATNAGKSVAL